MAKCQSRHFEKAMGASAQMRAMADAAHRFSGDLSISQQA